MSIPSSPSSSSSSSSDSSDSESLYSSSDSDIEINNIRPIRSISSIVPRQESEKQVQRSSSIPQSEFMEVWNEIFRIRTIDENEVRLKTHWPIATWSVLLIIIICYAVGIEEQKDGSSNWKNYVSPDDKAWWYYNHSPYPYCEDKRDEPWRAFSFQFVHNGFDHFIGNIIGLFVYGSLFETYCPGGPLSAIIIIQLSVFLGGIGFGYLWPYKGLVGASPGVFGCVGACLGFTIGSFESYPLAYNVLLPVIAIIQICLEIYNFFNAYVETTGYLSHFIGFSVGLTLSITISYISKCNIKKVFTICKPFSSVSPEEILESNLTSEISDNNINHQYQENYNGMSQNKKSYADLSSDEKCTYNFDKFILPPLAIISFTFFLLMLIFFSLQYTSDKVPNPYTNNFIHNYDNVNGCCSQLFTYSDTHSEYNLADIKDASVCSDNNLIVFPSLLDKLASKRIA